MEKSFFASSILVTAAATNAVEEDIAKDFNIPDPVDEMALAVLQENGHEDKNSNE